MTTVSRQNDALYAWSDGSFTWSNDLAARSWATAASWHFTFEVGETIGLSDRVIRGFKLELFSGLSVTETGYDDAFDKGVSESIKVAETYMDDINYSRRISEVIGVGELMDKRYVKRFESAFDVASSFVKTLTKNVQESATIDDGMNRQIAFVRSIAETIDVAETPSKRIVFGFDSAFKVVDARLQKANAVISDISILDHGISDNEFQAMMFYGSPPGYAPFRRFEPGEYTFEKALIQYVADAATADRLRLRDIKTYVDVPDVLERGLTDTNGGSTHVTFGRRFTIVPEVLVMLKSTSASPLSVPIINNVTENGFDVEVRDPNNTVVDATVSWVAHGY